VAPDIRSRSYRIDVHATFGEADSGVLITHGDAASGYSLHVAGGLLVHDMNIGGEHVLLRATRPVSPGPHVVGLRCRRLSREPKPTLATGPGLSEFTLLIDGQPVGVGQSRLAFFNFVSWAGLDIGCNRGSPVSQHPGAFAFTGKLVRVEVHMDDDQALDGDSLGAAELARE
jgi:arylsulfatase